LFLTEQLINALKVQECDATGDAMKRFGWYQKNFK
jgi:hypothetical protein